LFKKSALLKKAGFLDGSQYMPPAAGVCGAAEIFYYMATRNQ
jgi:hypothetical protein